MSKLKRIYAILFLLVQAMLRFSAMAWLSCRKVLPTHRHAPTMRLKGVATTANGLDKKEDQQFRQASSRTSFFPEPPIVIHDAEKLYGMPWKSSIDPNYEHGELFFMPFWEWQLEFMKTNLTNLRQIPTTDRTEAQNDLTYVENEKKKKRMITICFESDEYRLIRMTYLDAGLATQVFTSLWMPRANIPVLGIDFLQFNNQTRHLTVVDMQPIHPYEEAHDLKYTHLLEPIRESYPSLQHRMSDRFYDENQFFSPQMLLGRGEEGPEYVWEELFPAYKEYASTHVSLIRKALQMPRPTDFSEVLERQKAYDNYSSRRDPAHGLLKAIFGKNYADAFVYDILFPLSDGPL